MVCDETETDNSKSKSKHDALMFIHNRMLGVYLYDLCEFRGKAGRQNVGFDIMET